MKNLALVATLAVLLPSSYASLGINCRGSSQCGAPGVDKTQLAGLKQIVGGALSDQSIKGHEANRPYSNGQNVACTSTGGSGTGYFCAFYQNEGSGIMTLSQTDGFLQQLQDHGCKVCGSVPTKPGNNVATGELTVNYVLSPACDRGPGSYNGGDGASGWLCYPG